MGNVNILELYVNTIMYYAYPLYFISLADRPTLDAIGQWKEMEERGIMLKHIYCRLMCYLHVWREPGVTLLLVNDKLCTEETYRRNDTLV